MAENINEKVEEIKTEVIVDETSVASDIWTAVKQNWWKGLIGLATAVTAFAAGVMVGNRDCQDAAEPAIDDAPFDIDTASEI